ncbi:MAG: alanine-synthesizing transaminase [Candidatus Omnitrophota bacterium]|jgi:alanine-synthesizing transaminase
MFCPIGDNRTTGHRVYNTIMLFAKRAQWNNDTNPLMKAKADQERLGKAYIDMANTNPTQCDFEFLHNKSYGLLGTNRCAEYAASAKGTIEAREAISHYYASLNQKINPEDIILTSGTSEAYTYLFKLFCNPNDAILAPTPSYPLLDYLADVNDIQIKNYALEHIEGAWTLPTITPEEFKGAKACIVIQPGNPTGHIMRPKDLAFIESQCAAAQCALIIDEVFQPYTANGIRMPQPESKALSFKLNGISKLLALPQMKLSWIIVDGPTHLKAQAIEKLEVIADTYLSVSGPIQANLSAWLKQRDIIHQEINLRLKNNHATLEKILQNSPLCSQPRTGGWQSIIELPQDWSDEDSAIDLLKDKGVFLHPGYLYDLNHRPYWVVSLLLPEAQFCHALNEMLNFSYLKTNKHQAHN